MSQEFRQQREDAFGWQDWISCFSCLLMLSGMVFSRLLLSVGMILLFLSALHPGRLSAHWQKFKNSGYAWSALAFFAAFLLSGLWSSDKDNWLAVVQVKLPFLFFPFAMFSLPLKNRRWLKILTAGLLLSLLGGMCYSFYFAVSDAGSYAASGHMPSPMEGDYIRFTIVIVLALMFVVFFLKNRHRLKLPMAATGLMVLWALIAVAYIHLQAAKSGLVAFTIFGIAFIADYGIRQRKFGAMFLYLALFAAGEYAFSKTPSISHQVTRYAEEKKVMGAAVPNDSVSTSQAGSFILRLNSYKVASQIIIANPLLGVGAGDTKHEMDKLYIRQYPYLEEANYILPHNEFMCSVLAIGILLSLVSLAPMVFFPLFEGLNRKNIYMLTTWIILFFGLMIEPMLEVQFGIFVFLFFIHLWTGIPIKDQMPVHK